MVSIYDELMDKVSKDPSLASRGGARGDLGILLFSQREGIGELYKAAQRTIATFASAEAAVSDPAVTGAIASLRSSVEVLAPFFGER